MDEIYSRLESFIIEKMGKTKLPSLTISIVSGDEVAYSKAFGFKDIENGLAARTTTLYGIGSITKSFTCLAVMKLQEEGKLSINDPVEKYVPLKLKIKGEPVRIWHLMTHSSGIPALAYAEALIRGVIGEGESWIPIASYEDVISFLRDAEKWAVTKPGERFFYLNEGYVLLGYIIEKVSGLKYEEYVRKNILLPLGMKRSYFNKKDVERDGDLAVPYVVTEEGVITPSKYPWGITADGGLISNIHDMSKYILMYLNKGVLNGVRVASKETIEAMIKPRIDLPYKVFGDEKYGFGWSITNNFHGKKLVQHSGSVLVYTAWLGFMPEERVGVILLANGSGYPLSYIGMYALTLLLGKDPYKSLSQLRFEKLLEKLSGIYKTYKSTMTAKVYSKGSILYIETGGKYTKTTTPLFYEKSEDNIHYFTTIIGGRKLVVEFREKENTIELLYERYKLVKQ